jgi:hypothetical protein
LSVGLWAFDRNSLSTIKGAWRIDKLVVAQNGSGLPAKVGDCLSINETGFVAIRSTFENRIGIAGRSLCWGNCVTLRNFWTHISYSIRPTSSERLEIVDDGGFYLSATRAISCELAK